ncbi:cleavage and polyadenylation specificity factor subunit 1, partial [Phenoliferia sp. Uapishka_3]
MSHGANGEMSPDNETDDTTIAAGTVFGGSALVRVSARSVTLLEPDLTLAQSIDLGSTAKTATVLDEYVLVVSEDNQAQLFFANVETRTLEPIDVPPALQAANLAISIFTDLDRVVPLVRPIPQSSAVTNGFSGDQPMDFDESDEEDDLYATAPKRPHASQSTQKEAELVIPSASPRSWLPVVDASGAIKPVPQKIYALPSMDEVFSSAAIALLPMVITDGVEGSIPENVDPDDVEIERVSFFNVGQSRLRPHLIILLTNGSFAAYEGFPSVIAARPSTRPNGSLGVRFVKVLVKRLPAPRTKRQGDLEPARRSIVPFSHVQGYSGAFILGEDPFWLVASDHGPAHLYEHSEKGLYGFSGFTFGSEGGYLSQSRDGASVASLPENVCFDREMPYVRVPRDRRYAAFTFDLDSGLYVCGALFDTVFMNFDDDGKPVFVNDSPDLLEPTNYRSAVELVIPGTWSAIDGYEFRPNEFISVVKSVSLATRSTLSGRKDFIAVGTTVYRAEDLAARGGLYLFEVIKVVAHPDTPTHDHKLKLLTFEDTKSVVGNLCDIDGYLVMSMGQKLYVRAFEQDETLIAVGFLDVGVHVTSLQAMKNFLLIGDALQSVTLVAFQEDPYKLVLLGRDYRASRASSANFLVNDGRVAFVVGDIEGVLRLFEYDPTSEYRIPFRLRTAEPDPSTIDIASNAGQRLLCRTEYHAGAEGLATMLYAKRSGADEAKQNGILFGGIDGSIYTLVPVREAVFKRLLSLQTHLARHIQHFGGLNPRGFRMVKNDSVSRAITKGILDGELLAEFEWLPLDLQMLLTDLIKSDPDTISANLRNLAQSF